MVPLWFWPCYFILLALMELIWIRVKHLNHRLPSMLSPALNTPILHSLSSIWTQVYSSYNPTIQPFHFFEKEVTATVYQRTPESTITINWSTECLYILTWPIFCLMSHWMMALSQQDPEKLPWYFCGLSLLNSLVKTWFGLFPFLRWAPNLRLFLRSYNALIREIITFNKIIHLSRNLHQAG